MVASTVTEHPPTDYPVPARAPTRTDRISAFAHRRPRLRLAALLSAPMAWFGAAYLAALAALFISAFWAVDDFTGQIVRVWNVDNFTTLFTEDVYRAITLRTFGVALAVTLIDGLIAFPMAYYMARYASVRARRLLVIAILTPLWASYLVKAYSWRTMLADNGVIEWVLRPLGLHTPGYGVVATVMTLSYLWLPYMILPVHAGLEQIPQSLIEASADLGARGWRTFRSVILPTAFPALIAGSIFTFSLSLGDYIAVQIVGGTSQMLGNVVYTNVGAANNLPFASTVATVPVVIILLYLFAVRRTGALDNL